MGIFRMFVRINFEKKISKEMSKGSLHVILKGTSQGKFAGPLAQGVLDLVIVTL